jgi:hypothetical protein
MQGLLKKSLEPGAAWEPGKISEVFLDFARPLLEAEPGGPPDIAMIRNVMQIAMVCWNQPVYEAANHPLGAQARAALGQIVRRAPHPLGSLVRQLVDDRVTKFATVPFLVFVRVDGSDPTNARIVAEARTPPQKRIQHA